jgi:ligand-binding sensor domain-containing protein
MCPKTFKWAILIITVILLAACQTQAIETAFSPGGEPQPSPTETTPAAIPSPTRPPTWQFYSGLTPPLDDGLPSDDFIAIAAAPDGAVWAGTDNHGVLRNEKNAWSVFSQANGLADNSVHAFAFAPDGAGWAVSWFGAARYDGLVWQAYPFAEDFVGNDFHPIAVSPDGSVWVGGGRGLLRLQDGDWTPALADVDPAQLTAFALWADPDGSLWFGGNTPQLKRLQDGALAEFNLPDPPEGLRINALLRAADGALWLGTSHGLYRFNQDAWQTPQETGLEVWVTSLAQGLDGTLWAGTYQDGLYRLDGTDVEQFSTEVGFPNPGITGVAAAADGTVWAALRGGLASLPPSQP